MCDMYNQGGFAGMAISELQNSSELHKQNWRGGKCRDATNHTQTFIHIKGEIEIETN